MRLKRLNLFNFRNISQLEILPEQPLTFFVGDNAQGKTSIIESIYFLSTLRSFRTGKISDLIKKNEDAAQIVAEVTSRQQSYPQTLKTFVGTESRKLWINNKSVTASKFISRLKVVVFSPESLGAIKAGPEVRRELVDSALLQISEAGAMAQSQFSRALRQRNACLKQLRDGILGGSEGQRVLESLDLGYLKLAAEVTFERLKLLDEIFPIQREILSLILGENADVRFSYQSGGKEWQERSFGDIRARLIAELDDKTRRATEQTLGVTLTGPHRHDLSFLFNGNDSRIFCSQGQQRALILAFKIAEIVYHSKAFGTYPLLLLDDVLSEFDEAKKSFLIDFLRNHDAQTFLTTTDKTQVLQGCSVFQVKAGKIEKL